MGIALILLGLFLLFALGFNGSVGTDLVDKAFFTSAFFMIITGFVVVAKAKWSIVRALCAISLFTYLPMIWQRFNFRFGVDWGGFVVDIGIIIFLLILIIKKPNQALKKERQASPGAP